MKIIALIIQKNKLKIFFRSNGRKGNYIIEDVENVTFFGSTIENKRSLHMARLRNKLKSVHSDSLIPNDVNSYVLLLDSDAVFSLKTFEQMLTSMHSSPTCGMLSTLSLC